MSLLDLIDKLYKNLSELRKEKRHVNKSKLDEIVIICESLAASNSLNKNEILLLHEKAKSLYKNITVIFANEISHEDIDIIIRALASSRILFWLNVLKNKNDPEIVMLLKEYLKIKLRPSIHNNARPSSLSLRNAIRELKEIKNTGHCRESALHQIKRSYYADIADLKSLTLKYM